MTNNLAISYPEENYKDCLIVGEYDDQLKWIFQICDHLVSYKGMFTYIYQECRVFDIEPKIELKTDPCYDFEFATSLATLMDIASPGPTMKYPEYKRKHRFADPDGKSFLVEGQNSES